MTKFLLLVLFTLLTTGCFSHKSAKSEKVAPAKVEKLPLETEIARITLTPEATGRLGIAISPVVEQDVQRHRTLSGEVQIPSGKSILVAAPFAGTVFAPGSSTIPSPGQRLAMGDNILTLAPLLTPERNVPTPAEQVQMANARATLLAAISVAQGDRDRGAAEVDAAKIALARSEKLLADRAGSQRAVDDAQALLNVNQSVLSAAIQREEQLSKLIKELDTPSSERTASPVEMKAPQAGVLRSLAVSPGQLVTAGASLYEIVDVGKIWIRVPVYVEMLTDIDTLQPAQIVALGGSLDTQSQSATESTQPGSSLQKAIVLPMAFPFAAPPTADALSSSVDLYFECDNRKGSFRPGQRLGIQLALRGQSRGLTVPAESVLYDIYGGAWVYVQTAEHVFERQHILIRYMLGDRIVLAEGPAAGTQVVTHGAAELFGTEFGAGK